MTADFSLLPAPTGPRSSRRVLRFVVSLLVIVLAGEALTRFVVEARRDLESPTKDIQVERQLQFIGSYIDGVDIVVAGTSMTAVGIDPQVVDARTSNTSFNASLGCGNPLVMQDWLLNHVADELDPEVVVLAVAPTDLDRDACRRNWAPIDQLTTPTNQRQTDPRHYLRQHSALWRNRDWLRGINNLPFLVFDKEWTWDVTFRPDGFWQIDDYARVDTDTYLLNPSRTQIRIEQPFVDAVVAAIDGLQARGITVVIAEVPMAQRWIDHLEGSNLTYQAAQAELRAIAERRGATYVGVIPALHANERFIDEGHMNPDATRLYSMYLGDALAGLD